eukprot:2448202-Rhodomonas_salina.3
MLRAFVASLSPPVRRRVLEACAQVTKRAREDAREDGQTDEWWGGWRLGSGADMRVCGAVRSCKT